MDTSQKVSKTHSLLQNIQERRKRFGIDGKDPRHYLGPMLAYFREHPLNLGGMARSLGISRREAIALVNAFADKVAEIEEDFLDEMEEKIILCGLGRAGDFRISDALTVLERRRSKKWSKQHGNVGGKKGKRAIADDSPDGPRDESWRSEIGRFQHGKQRASVRLESKSDGQILSTSHEGSDGSDGSGEPPDGDDLSNL